MVPCVAEQNRDLCIGLRHPRIRDLSFSNQCHLKPANVDYFVAQADQDACMKKSSKKLIWIFREQISDQFRVTTWVEIKIDR